MATKHGGLSQHPIKVCCFFKSKTFFFRQQFLKTATNIFHSRLSLNSSSLITCIRRHTTSRGNSTHQSLFYQRPQRALAVAFQRIPRIHVGFWIVRENVFFSRQKLEPNSNPQCKIIVPRWFSLHCLVGVCIYGLLGSVYPFHRRRGRRLGRLFFASALRGERRRRQRRTTDSDSERRS